MTLTRNALRVNAAVFFAAGAVLVARPELIWDSYSEDDVTKLVDIISRLLGGIMMCSGVLCGVSSMQRMSSGTQERVAMGFASGAALVWTLVHGVDGLGEKSVHDTYAGMQGGIGGVLILFNSTVLMLDIFSRIPSDAIFLRREFEHNEEEEQEPLLGDDEAHIPVRTSKPAVFSLNDDDESETPQRREHDGKKKPEKGWAKLIDLAKPEQKILYSGCLALLIRLPFSMSIPHFVAECIGCLVNQDQSGAIRNIIFLIAAGTIDAMLDFWNFFLFGFAQQRLVKRLRCTLFKTLLGMDIGFYDGTSTGEVASRLLVDTSEMGNDLTWVFRWTIEAVVRILGVIGYMYVREWRLASISLSVTPICAVINKVYGDWLSKNAEKVQATLADSNKVAEEVLSSVRTVYSFHNQEYETQRYEETVFKWYNLNIKQTFMQALYYMSVATFLFNTCVQAAILLYGTRLVIHEGMDASILFAFMLYQAMLQQWITALLNSFTNLIKSTGAGAKVFELLEQPPPPRSKDLVPEAPEGHTIELQDVFFKYPTREAEVLKGISFKVRPGETVALVGLSGAGKSTLFHLLEKFYDPCQGSVLLDGMPVADIDSTWLHSNVALVGQEPVLFSGTIRSNILYSLLQRHPNLMKQMEEDSTLRDEMEGRVRDAVRLANATEFISKLPDEMDTEVGEKGAQLSGGQKQRIAIARALIQDPGVLLLDEATSALDSSSERVVQKALEAAAKGRTTLVIAHRLSTVARADCILVLDGGRVVQQGTHEELLAAPQATDPNQLTYRTLVEQQMRPQLEIEKE